MEKFEYLRDYDVICLGLGNISESISSILQLAFLLALREKVQLGTVTMYDPCFTEDEIIYFRELDLNVEEIYSGKNDKTLYYMIHWHSEIYSMIDF